MICDALFAQILLAFNFVYHVVSFRILSFFLPALLLVNVACCLLLCLVVSGPVVSCSVMYCFNSLLVNIVQYFVLLCLWCIHEIIIKWYNKDIMLIKTVCRLFSIEIIHKYLYLYIMIV